MRPGRMTPRHGAGSARSAATRSAATRHDRPHCPAWSGTPPTAAEFHIKLLAAAAGPSDVGHGLAGTIRVEPDGDHLVGAALPVEAVARMEVSGLAHLEARLGARLDSHVVANQLVHPERLYRERLTLPGRSNAAEAQERLAFRSASSASILLNAALISFVSSLLSTCTKRDAIVAVRTERKPTPTIMRRIAITRPLVVWG